MPSSSQHRQAFTLIELSIVLVVIGLIIGGVMVGRELYVQSVLRGQLATIERYYLAVRTFKLKYNCIPGDCLNATSFGLGTGGGPGQNGDGNEIINYNSSGEFAPFWSYQQERLNFWYHLAQAGLIEGGYKGYDTATNPATNAALRGYNPEPALGKPHDAGGGGIPSIVPWVTYLAIVTMHPSSYGYALNTRDTYWMDAKIDNALPLTGKLRISSSYSALSWNSGTSYGCNTNNTNAYDTSGSWNSYGGPADNGHPERVECGLIFMNKF